MKERKLREKIDKLITIYLARTIAVNRFGLREKLLGLYKKELLSDIEKQIDKKFVKWASKIPYPDPITQMEEIRKILRK